MAFSSRMRWALGLGLLGVIGVVGVSRGQGDGAVKQTAGPGATPAPRPFPAGVVGSIDLEVIIQGSEKAKFQNEQLKAEVNAKNAHAQSLIAQGKQIAKEMESLTPGTADFKDREKKITELRASMQANKENGEREFEVRYAECMASFYTDLQDMIKRVADSKGLTCVVLCSTRPVSVQDPQMLMARIQSPIIYTRADTDITKVVLYNLNKEYVEKGGKIVKPPVAEADTVAPTPTAPPRGPAASNPGNTRKK